MGGGIGRVFDVILDSLVADLLSHKSNETSGIFFSNKKGD
jgi:hypothetical protein